MPYVAFFRIHTYHLFISNQRWIDKQWYLKKKKWIPQAIQIELYLRMIKNESIKIKMHSSFTLVFITQKLNCPVLSMFYWLHVKYVFPHIVQCILWLPHGIVGLFSFICSNSKMCALYTVHNVAFYDLDHVDIMIIALYYYNKHFMVLANHMSWFLLLMHAMFFVVNYTFKVLIMEKWIQFFV